MFYKVQNELKPVMKFITFNILKRFAVIQLSEITWSSPKLAKCFIVSEGGREDPQTPM